MVDSCACPLAGYCDRHQCKKTSNLHKLCQQGGDYWDAWERGTGPGQVPPQPAEKQLARRKRIEERVQRDQRMRGWVSLFRVLSDTGLGDTLVRLIPMAAKKPLLKAELQQLQRQCGCRIEDATAELNKHYPYAQTNVTMPNQ